MTVLTIRLSFIEITCLYFLLHCSTVYPPKCLVIGNIVSVNYCKCSLTKMLKSSLFCPLHKLYKGGCLPHLLVFSEVSLISAIIFLLLWGFFRVFLLLFLCICMCLTFNWSQYDTVSLSFSKRGVIQKFPTGVFFTVTRLCYLCNVQWPVEGGLFTYITFPVVLHIPYCTLCHFRGFRLDNHFICYFLTSRLEVSL